MGRSRRALRYDRGAAIGPHISTRLFTTRAAGLLLLAAAALCASFALACTQGTDQTPTASPTVATREGPTIRIAAFNFAESQILAEIYAQQLEARGFAVDRSQASPGSLREALQPALEAGEIDLLPEYVGTMVTSLGGTATSDGAANRQAAADLYEARGVTVLPLAAEAEDVNALVITSTFAEEHNVATVSDLVEHAGDLVLGGPPECPERQFCLVGLREVYGIEFRRFVPLEFEDRITALQEGDIDVAVLFSTDAAIHTNHWVVLDDDRGLQPAENIAPVIRTEVVSEYGEAGDDLLNAINAVTAKLTSESLAEMNADADVDGRTVAEIARTWLVENDLVEGTPTAGQ